MLPDEYRRDVEAIARCSPKELRALARQLGVPDVDKRGLDELVDFICSQDSDVQVESHELSLPGRDVDGQSAPIRRQVRTRKRARVDWFRKYGMPFRPGTAYSIVWEWLAQKRPDVKTIETELRMHLLAHRLDAGVAVGFVLVTVLRKAAERGWTVQLVGDGPLSFRRLVVTYVGKTGQLPPMGIEELV